MPIKKAIIPVAGRGVRWLPLTKSLEKCMLPVGSRPIIDFVVQDCIEAGITDFYFIVAEKSEQLQSYYRTNSDLEDYLSRSGLEQLLPVIRPPAVNFHFIVQPSDGKYGTAVPVSLALPYIDTNENVLVYMGDNYLAGDGGSSVVSQLLAQTPEGQSSLVGLKADSDPYIQRYGFIELDQNGNLLRLTDRPAVEPSPFIKNVSIYALSYRYLEAIQTYVKTDKPSGEYLIFEAFMPIISQGQPMHVLLTDGHYLDAGTPESWFRANQFIFNQNG